MKDYLTDSIYKLNRKVNYINEINLQDKERLFNLIEYVDTAFEMTVQERLKRDKPRRGEIWLCNFGINVGSEICKVRPAIVTQVNDLNDKLPTTIVMPITSKSAHHDTEFAILTEYLIENCFENDVTGSASAVQTRNVSIGRLFKKIGELNEVGLNIMDEKILRVMGIAI